MLQGRSKITAAELATELEVSVPTARRDLEALAMAGVPIYPTRGRGGGWQLIGGARTDLTGLTEAEATSLLIGLAQAGTSDPERMAALRKVVRAVPEPFREGAERVAAATVRDVPWGAAEDSAATAPAVAELQRAIARRLRVAMTYDGSRGAVDLDVVPLVVGSRGQQWYLLAAPVTAGEEVADAERVRTYRVDRIAQLRTTPQRGVAPTGFDPQQAWVGMVDRVEDLRGGVRAVVRVQPWAVRALLGQFGPQARVLPDAQGDDARAVIEVRAHRADALAEQLAGWTSVAEVLEPAAVREELARLGSRLVAAYAPPEIG